MFSKLDGTQRDIKNQNYSCKFKPALAIYPFLINKLYKFAQVYKN